MEAGAQGVGEHAPRRLAARSAAWQESLGHHSSPAALSWQGDRGSRGSHCLALDGAGRLWLEPWLSLAVGGWVYWHGEQGWPQGSRLSWVCRAMSTPTPSHGGTAAKAAPGRPHPPVRWPGFCSQAPEAAAAGQTAGSTTMWEHRAVLARLLAFRGRTETLVHDFFSK